MNLASKRILVTGGSGFLGKHVVDILATRGCDIHHLPIRAQRTVKPADTGVWVPRSAAYNLTLQDDTINLLDDTRPHLIIHLAALTGGIGANRAKPADFFYRNLSMGLELLQKACEWEVEKFVGIGSVCSYPKHANIPFREEEIWNGYPEETNAPYGLAKKMLLVQSAALRQQYGFNAINLLPVNLYGPGDNFDLQTAHVIPALIRKLMLAQDAGKRAVTLWGTGTASREFLYVTDAAEAIVTAAEVYNAAEPLNLGSGLEIQIKQLADVVAEVVGYTGRIEWDSSKPDGQPRRLVDSSRAEQHIGFRTQTSLRSGLSQTAMWFQQHLYPR